jgi:hypothetical protein
MRVIILGKTKDDKGSHGKNCVYPKIKVSSPEKS